MRLVTYAKDDQTGVGVVASDNTVVPVNALDRNLPNDMIELIEAGTEAWSRLANTARAAHAGVPLESVALLAPIPRPRRGVFGVGLNYVEHFDEGQGKRGASAVQQLPQWPSFFTKNPGTVIGPDANVWHPHPHSEKLDWEIELAAVIGRRGIDVREEEAQSYVFAYTVANDLSVRDIQRRHGGQWWKGKNFDSHLPLGPWLVTVDELTDPYSLDLDLRVNGVVKQHSNTRFMHFTIARIIHDLSVGMELEPGDIILTGTPSGVGAYRDPPEFLRPGDVVEAEIERIGTLRSHVTLKTGRDGQARDSLRQGPIAGPGGYR